MANKRITDLDTQGDIDTEVLKLVTDSIEGGTKSITLKRVLDLIVKEAEIKQAEQDIGRMFTWQGLPLGANFLATGVFKLGKRFFGLCYGDTIVNGVTLYPKYKEFLQGLRNEILFSSIVSGNNYVMPQLFNHYLKQGIGGENTTFGKISAQSLPGLKTGQFLTRRHENPGQPSVPLIEKVEGIIERIEGQDPLSIPSYIKKEDVPEVTYRRDIVRLKPAYDGDIDVGGVNPANVQVFMAVCIGVDYD